jgi:hypothetical protein
MLKQKITDKSIPEPNSGCWLWTAGLDGGGYGNVWDGSRTRMAHAVAFEVWKGPIQNGHEIDHLCRTHGCVNPDHLQSVPHRVNVLRGIGITALHAAKTHCPSGHPYDEANTYKHRGRRLCRVCNRAAALRHYHRRKEAKQ